MNPSDLDKSELDKWAAVSDRAAEITDFLEWAESRGTALAEWSSSAGHPIALQSDLQLVLYDYFEIDVAQLERERRALLAQLRMSL